MSYATLVVREVDDDGDSFYAARHPELPGCMAQGDDPAAALRSLIEARTLYLEALAKHSVPIPAPIILKSGVVFSLDRKERR